MTDHARTPGDDGRPKRGRRSGDRTRDRRQAEPRSAPVRREGRPGRVTPIVLTLLLLAGGFAGLVAATPVAPVAAITGGLKLPVPAGAAWTVGQGYNTWPTEGGSHWACDPATLRDRPTQSASCRAHYQYQWSFDLARADGATAGQPVLAPADGTVRWTDPAFGGGSIDLGDGYAFAFFHADLAATFVAGATVRRGQRLGTVSPPGGGGNGGWPHLHITLWRTTDGGNWVRNAAPFTDAYALEGYDFPAQSTSIRNQYRGTTLYSTNSDTGGGGTSGTPPPVPVLTGPPNSTGYSTPLPRPVLTWAASSGAVDYQVVVNDGQIVSPWLAGTSWTMPALQDGQYAWQVRARGPGGTSALSPKWIVRVVSAEATTTPSPRPTVSGGGTPGALAVTVSPSSAAVGASVALRGAGFAGGETVRLYLDSTATTPVATLTADSVGNWGTSLAMPAAPRGPHAIVARGASSGRQSAATVSITPSLARDPYAGPVGTVVRITVRGFGANESVQLNWDTASGPTLGTARTDGTGVGSVTVTIPASARGWHDYTGVGLTTGARAYGAFGVEPSLTLSPVGGVAAAGQAITATVRGFSARSAVSLAWNRNVASAGTPLCSGTTDAAGSFACQFAVPAGSGSFPVVATGADGTTKSTTVAVGGGASLSLAPASGAVGTNLAVTIGGFAAGEPVDLRWDGGTVWVTGTADPSGAVSTQATVPFLAYGAHTLSARGRSSGRTAAAAYSVRQSMALSPAGGAPGGATTVYVRGFQAGQPVAVAWNRTGTSAGTTVCSGTTNATGTYSCSFRVPSVAGGSYPVVATAGSVAASVTFSVTSTGGGTSGGTVGGGQVIGPGVYRVTATREGLVGGTTSNGHVITPNDRFVALPTCTASSCPWLTPGVRHPLWGLRVECAPNCYVQVTNAATGVCAVAPVWDVGPWFTNDDWWNPTETRTLNNQGTTRNVLRQGYPGAEAARDGLDVGYGIAPSGIGISNKGYVTGNRAAIDIGDGTWRDLGFDFNAGITHGGAIVSMLWQTGENPQTAASRCGQGAALPSPTATRAVGATPTRAATATATRAATATATRTPTRAATRTTPTATPTRAATWVAATATRTATRVTATPTRVKTTATATPVVRPPSNGRLTLSTAAGQVGTRLRVTGGGFRPGETVRVRWDLGGITLRTVTADASGRVLADVSVPPAAWGSHSVNARGDVSGTRGSAPFSVLPSLSRTPYQGVAGTAVRVTVRGFGPYEFVRLTWDTMSGAGLGTVRTDATGTGQVTIRIPAASAGWHDYVGVGSTTRARAYGAIQVLPGAPFTGAEVEPTPGDGDAVTTATAAPSATPTVASRWTPTATATPVVTPPVTVTPTQASTATAVPDAVPDAVSRPTSTATALATATATPTRPAAPTTTPAGTAAASPLPTLAVRDDVTFPTARGSSTATAVPPTPSPSATVPADTATATEGAERDGDDVVLPAAEPTPPADATVTAMDEATATIPPTETPTTVATETPTVTPIPTDVPTQTPTTSPTAESTATVEPTATATPAPTVREGVLVPIADTSVRAVVPEGTPVADAVEPAGTLAAGGPTGAMTYLTFEVTGVAPGTVVDATLVVTGAGATGGQGGPLGALPGVAVDEWGATYANTPAFSGSALTAAGVPVDLGWVEPGVQVAVDVTGTVANDGTLTFVLVGTTGAEIAISSREGTAPPLLLLTIADPGSPAP